MYTVILYDNPDEQNGIVIHQPNANGYKIEGTIKKEINKIDTFTFGMTLENIGYGKIKPFKSFITVFNNKTNKREFRGRVYGPTEIMSETGMVDVSYTCEGELSYLTDSQQRHLEFRGTTLEAFTTIIEYHNSQVEEYKRFEVGRVEIFDPNDYMYFYLSAEQNTWDALFEKLIDKLGGELQIRYENGVRYLDWLERIGYDSDTEIRLARNLMSITRTVDPSEIITRLTPLGARIESEDPDATDASQARLTIEEVNNGIPYIDRPDLIEEFGIIGGAIVWDDITLPSNLLAAGQKWINNQKVALYQYEISALDLSLIGLDIDNFEVGNSYPVYNPIMNIDERLRIVGKTININNPQDASLKIGDKFKTLNEYQVDAYKATRKVVELESIINSQLRTITGLRKELEQVNTVIEDVQQAIKDMDIDALDQAIDALEDAIQNLQEAISQIPAYGPVTPTSDGLMIAADKVKLDRITVLNNIDLDELKAKLDLIKVLQSTDLDVLRDKLDLISVANQIDLDSLKNKLDLITVANQVDLDDLVARVEALENADQTQ